MPWRNTTTFRCCSKARILRRLISWLQLRYPIELVRETARNEDDEAESALPHPLPSPQGRPRSLMKPAYAFDVLGVRAVPVRVLASPPPGCMALTDKTVARHRIPGRRPVPPVRLRRPA